MILRIDYFIKFRLKKDEFISRVRASNSKTHLMNLYGWNTVNGGLRANIDILLFALGEEFTDQLAADHWVNRRNLEFQWSWVVCPTCGFEFANKIGADRETKTCSSKCAGRLKSSDSDKHQPHVYRKICFQHHPHMCCICEHDRLLMVHHVNFDRTDNDKFNLVPICRNHHADVHWGEKKYKERALKRIDLYVDFFKMKSKWQSN